MRFPLCRAPYPDELLYGYMRALCLMNGIGSMSDLEADIFASRAHLYIKYPSGLHLICDTIENETFPKIEEAAAMTTLNDELAYLDDKAGSRLSDAVLYAESPAFPKIAYGNGDGIRICPICRKIDERLYGSPYLHKPHHLDGVMICPEHGVSLLRLPDQPRRRTMKVLSIDNGVELRQSTAMSIASDIQDVLVKRYCTECGRMYMIHPWSDISGLGCPYCLKDAVPAEIVQKRLDVMYDGEYAVTEISSFTRAKVRHTPCGSVTGKLEYLLYGDRFECRGCLALTADMLQKRVDPAEAEWAFLPTTEEMRKNKRIRVKHKKCGKIYEMFRTSFNSIEGGRCPECDSKQKQVDMFDGDGSEYELAGRYMNNRNKVKIRHKSCGIVFETSKTSFIAGCRCPVCVPRYSYEDVRNALTECGCLRYTVSKAEKRGYVYVTDDEGFEKTYSYQAVMLDLKADEPGIFTDRKKRYVDSVSIRKTILDHVIEFTKKNGCWTFRDGLNGVDITYDRLKRNIVQDMARLGYIKRNSRGRYIAYGKDEEER